MKLNNVKPGLEILTNGTLGTTAGMTIAYHHLSARRPNAKGRVLCQSLGHGGDVWFVRHDLGAAAAYTFTEFQPAERETVAFRDLHTGEKNYAAAASTPDT